MKRQWPITTSGNVVSPQFIVPYKTTALDIKPLECRLDTGGKRRYTRPINCDDNDSVNDDKTIFREPNYMSLIYNGIVERYERLLSQSPAPPRVHIASTILTHPTYPTLLMIQPHNAGLLDKYNIPGNIRPFVDLKFIQTHSDASYLSILLKALEIWQSFKWVTVAWHRVAAKVLYDFIAAEVSWR